MKEFFKKHNGKAVHVHGLELTLWKLKMANLPVVPNRFSVSQAKVPVSFL